MAKFFVLLSGALLFAWPDGKEMPAQAAKGKAIFLESTSVTKCATCHELNHQGTAIGPDLTKIARMSPKAFEISMLSTRTVYAKEIELKTRRKFAAIIASETPRDLTVYSLDKIPPEKMTLEKMSIHAVRDNGTWKHPPESGGYSKTQIADVIAFIRFVADGDVRGVDPASLK